MPPPIPPSPPFSSWTPLPPPGPRNASTPPPAGGEQMAFVEYHYTSTFGFFFAIDNSFRLAPLGLPRPCSHDWTVLGEIFRYLANTAWVRQPSIRSGRRGLGSRFVSNRPEARQNRVRRIVDRSRPELCQRRGDILFGRCETARTRPPFFLCNTCIPYRYFHASRFVSNRDTMPVRS